MRDKIKRSRLAIHDMLDAIDTTRSAVAGLDFPAYEQSVVNRLAAERGIEIISEASRRVADDLKALEPGKPWPKVAAIGNILRHEYRDVSAGAIWNVIENDLTVLESALRRMLLKIGSD